MAFSRTFHPNGLLPSLAVLAWLTCPLTTPSMITGAITSIRASSNGIFSGTLSSINCVNGTAGAWQCLVCASGPARAVRRPLSSGAWSFG
jgi:hypothetical protein